MVSDVTGPDHLFELERLAKTELNTVALARSILLDLIARIRDLEAKLEEAGADGRKQGLEEWMPEIYMAFEKLNAPNSLLALFGSVNDTLPEVDCLALLREYNREGSYMSNESGSAASREDLNDE